MGDAEREGAGGQLAGVEPVDVGSEAEEIEGKDDEKEKGGRWSTRFR
jgi:hypothetical protein